MKTLDERVANLEKEIKKVLAMLHANRLALEQMKTASEIGKAGGRRSLETMTPEQRKARASKAAKAMWAKKRGSK